MDKHQQNGIISTQMQPLWNSFMDKLLWRMLISIVFKWKKIFLDPLFAQIPPNSYKIKLQTTAWRRKKKRPTRKNSAWFPFFFSSNLKTSDWQNQQEVQRLWMLQLTMDTLNPVCAFSHLLFFQSAYWGGWISSHSLHLVVCPVTASPFLFAGRVLWICSLYLICSKVQS